MTNLAKIINYFNSLYQKCSNLLAQPDNLFILAGVAVIVIVAAILSWRFNKKFHFRRFPKCIIHQTIFPILIFSGILILSIINLLITAHLANILYLLNLLSLAGIVITAIHAIIRFAYPRNYYLNNFNRLISIFLWITVIVMITDQNDDIINLMDNITFHIGKTHQVSVWDILHGIIITIIAITLARLLIQYSEHRISRVRHIDNNLQQILIRIGKIIIVVFTLIVTLPMIGVDVTTLSIFGGAIGVGVGFGLQKITSNFLSGFIILFDRSIKVGDRLIIDNNTGIVKQITTRYVVMERFDGTEVLIPNETFITNNIQNQSYSSTKLRSELTFTVSDNDDISHALELIKHVVSKAPNTLTEKALVSINNVINNSVEIKAYFWVDSPSFITDANNYIYINVVKLFKDNLISSPKPSQRIEIINATQGSQT